MEKLKTKTYNLLQNNENKASTKKVFDIALITLIILNSFAVLAETTRLGTQYERLFQVFELFSVIIFTIEYLFRFWVSDLSYPQIPRWKARIKYITSGMAIIDLLAILPFYIPFLIPLDLRVLRTLRIFRLFRLFKANRYTNSMNIILKVLKKRASELFSSVIVILILMIVSSALVYGVENQAQPEVFESIFHALWWAVATFTTVGYGDIYPITALGKFLSAIVAILGIGLVAIPTGIITSGFTEEIQRKAQICPHCGKTIKDDN